MLKAYGAEVVVCPTAVPPEHPDSYYSTSDRLVRETPGAWKPDQYSNPNGPLSHYETTGPEIWRDTDGRVTHFVTGRRHRRHDLGRRPLPARGLGRPRGGPGARHRRRPRGLGLLRRHRPPLPRRGRRRGLLALRLRPGPGRRGRRGHRRRLLRDDPSPRPRGGPARRRLVRHGGRRRAARRQGPARRTPSSSCCCPTRAAATCPRSSTTSGCSPTASCAPTAGAPSATCCTPRPATCPALVHTHPTETLRDAIEILREYDVSQMPVVNAEPPVMSGEVAGAVVRARPARGAVHRQGAPGRLGRRRT